MSEYKEYTFEIIQEITVTAEEQQEVKDLAEKMGLDWLNLNGYPSANSIDEFVHLYCAEYYIDTSTRFESEAPFLLIGGFTSYMHSLHKECVEDEEYRVEQ